MRSRWPIVAAAALAVPLAGCLKDLLSSPSASNATPPADVGAGPTDAGAADLASTPAMQDAGSADLGAASDLSPKSSTALRINVYGNAYDGVDYKGSWAADPGMGGACDGNVYDNVVQINGTNDDPLFQGESWGNPLNCTVGTALPPGNYKVNLYFAEIYWGPGCPGGGAGTGVRVFNIALEGQTVLSNFDIFAEGGCAASTTDATTKPVVKSFTVAVNDGTLNVTMNASADDAKISAIEVLAVP